MASYVGLLAHYRIVVFLEVVFFCSAAQVRKKPLKKLLNTYL